MHIYKLFKTSFTNIFLVKKYLEFLENSSKGNNTICTWKIALTF